MSLKNGNSIINGDNEEKQLLKRKMASYCNLAFLDKWTLDDAIYISFLKDNCILINNPNLKANLARSDNIIDINVSKMHFESLGIHLADFLLHFLIHSIKPKYSCVMFVYCPLYAEKLVELCAIKPVSQESLLINAHHMVTFDYDTYVKDLQRCATNENDLKDFLRDQLNFLTKALHQSSKLLLKNRGFLVAESSVENCWFQAYLMMYFVDTYMTLGHCMLSEHLILPSLKSQNMVEKYEVDGPAKQIVINKQEETPAYKDGELEFEAVMRYLNDAGLKTEYPMKEVSIWKK